VSSVVQDGRLMMKLGRRDTTSARARAVGGRFLHILLHVSRNAAPTHEHHHVTHQFTPFSLHTEIVAVTQKNPNISRHFG
jgi:hypothetical protein